MHSCRQHCLWAVLRQGDPLTQPAASSRCCSDRSPWSRRRHPLVPGVADLRIL